MTLYGSRILSRINTDTEHIYMISERLKILISYMNLSQKDFAISIGLTPSSLNDILNGRTKNIIKNFTNCY